MAEYTVKVRRFQPETGAGAFWQEFDVELEESLSVLDALSDDEVETLFQAITPITRIVVEAGDVPAMTPMALRRNELDDASAHLSA